jgi:hypothetical protein
MIIPRDFLPVAIASERRAKKSERASERARERERERERHSTGGRERGTEREWSAAVRGGGSGRY